MVKTRIKRKMIIFCARQRFIYKYADLRMNRRRLNRTYAEMRRHIDNFNQGLRTLAAAMEEERNACNKFYTKH